MSVFCRGSVQVSDTKIPGVAADLRLVQPSLDLKFQERDFS